MKKILVLCTGNRFRSPMLAHVIRELRPDWDVRSAGTRCGSPEADVPGTWRRCLPTWVAPHAARKVTAEDVAWADVVIGVQESHRQADAKKMIVHRLVDPAFRRTAEWPTLAEQVRTAAQQIVEELE